MLKSSEGEGDHNKKILIFVPQNNEEFRLESYANCLHIYQF